MTAHDRKPNCSTPSTSDGEGATTASNQRVRPLRILHLGNIANNAYLNARLLRDAGIDCDVLSPDYSHIMGCPEWEEADFDGEIGDAFHPDWRRVDLHGYARPDWFAQGPFELAALYLIARRDGRRRATALFGWLLAVLNRLWPPHDAAWPVRLAGWFVVPVVWIVRRLMALGRWLPGLGFGPADRQRLAAAAGAAQRSAVYLRCLARNVVWLALLPLWAGGFVLIMVCARLALGRWPPWDLAWLRSAPGQLFGRPNASPFRQRYRQQAAELNHVFARMFPGRCAPWPDVPLRSYDYLIPLLAELFGRYDVVQAYATTGIYPLLANSHPYIAYEHGTIRQMPFEATPEGSQLALAYRLADATCITNADNQRAAERLGLPHYGFVPHPIAEAALVAGCGSELRGELLQRFDADFLVFHPARQHWAKDCPDDANWAKANDRLIDALCGFFATEAPRGAAIFVDWGASVAESKRRIAQSAVGHRFHWIAPCHGRQMARFIDACDVTADQFFLGAFGAIVPKGLALGKPVLCYVNTQLHAWCFPEPPPLLNVQTADEIHAALARVYGDTAFRNQLSAEAADWYRRYHSQDIVRQRLQAMYDEVLNSKAVFAEPASALQTDHVSEIHAR